MLPGRVRFRVMSSESCPAVLRRRGSSSRLLPAGGGRRPGERTGGRRGAAARGHGAHGARKALDAARASCNERVLLGVAEWKKPTPGDEILAMAVRGGRKAVRTFTDDEREDNGGDLDDQGQEGHHCNPVGCDQESDSEMRESTRNGNVFALTERRACPEMTGDIRFRKHIVL